MDKATVDAARQVAKGLRGLKQAVDVVEAAAQAEEELKARQAKLASLDQAIAVAAKQHNELLDRGEAVARELEDVLKHADAGIAEAKKQQAQAEREATEAIARATRAGLDREEQMNVEFAAKEAQANGRIAQLEKIKTQLEADIKSLKEKFA